MSNATRIDEKTQVPLGITARVALTVATAAAFCFAGVWWAADQSARTRNLETVVTEFRTETRENFKDLNERLNAASTVRSGARADAPVVIRKP